MDILFGYDCIDSRDCDKSSSCKYAKHKFIPFKISHLLFVYPRCIKLSGTNKCPYNKTRNYTCASCANSNSFEECDIPFNERKPYIPKDRWKKYSRCGSYKKCKWADDCLYDGVYVSRNQL